MKKFVLIIFFISAISQSVAQDFFYWYKNTRQELFLDNHRQYITVKSLSDVDSIKYDLTARGIRYDEFKRINVAPSFNDTLNVYWTFLYLPDSVGEYTNPLISYSSPSYILANGKQVGISHLVYVMLKLKSDTVSLKQLADNLGAAVLGENNMIPRLYTLSCTNASTFDALGTANALHSTGLFEYAEPDIMGYEFFYVNDTYFPDQWALNNTGQFWGTSGIDINYCAARQITTGNSNVVVAVVDEGVELNHPDLTNMYALSYDAENDTFPSIVLGSHGTACAGIIGAAANNGIGVAGIAPDCPIMSISVDVTAPNSTPKIAASFRFARDSGASVISNSWGGGVLSNTMENAIDSAYTYGRNGNGCVIVFATGNGNDSVSYPATNDKVIAVGAISHCGERFSPTSCDGYPGGSNFGSWLDVVAPGTLIATTDRLGNNGYNNGQTNNVPSQIGMPVISDYTNLNYTLAFGKTSAAAPHVSGVAALMLSVNPNLTAAQVAHIIKGTAQKIGGYTYLYHANHLNGRWNIEMGHGLVDAAAAVTVAAASTHDLYIRDSSTDAGAEPNLTTSAVNLSPDIKIKTLSGYEVTSLLGGTTYNIEVTVRNCGTETVTFNPDSLFLCWIANNSNPMWKNSWFSPDSLCNMPLGGTIPGSIPSRYPTITPGNSTTITRQWTAPSIGGCLSPYYSTSLHIVAKVKDGVLTIGDNDTNFPLEQFVRTNNNAAWHQYTLSLDPVFPAITSISPNPTSGQTVVSYRLGENHRSGASLAVVTATGNRVMTVPLAAGDGEGSANLNLQSVPSGQYIIQLISSGEVFDAKPLVVE